MYVVAQHQFSFRVQETVSLLDDFYGLRTSSVLERERNLPALGEVFISYRYICYLYPLLVCFV
jgi:hypothetical protein